MLGKFVESLLWIFPRKRWEEKNRTSSVSSHSQICLHCRSWIMKQILTQIALNWLFLEGKEATTPTNLYHFKLMQTHWKKKLYNWKTSVHSANRNQYVHTHTFVMHMMNTMAMIVFTTKLSICPKALKLYVFNVGPSPYQYVFAWHSSTFGISANMLFLSIRCLFAIKQKGIEIKHSTANHLVHN